MPDFYLFGGPNGAGKTTTATKILPELLNCREFVNADYIARGLSPFTESTMAMQAGRIMLRRLKELSKSGVDFAFESTLAARNYVVFLKRCQERGYKVNLIYVWPNSPDLAVNRVAKRVNSGGHAVPEEVIRRRYELGRTYFLTLYRPLADWWACLDNSGETSLPVAQGTRNTEPSIYEPARWKMICAPHCAPHQELP